MGPHLMYYTGLNIRGREVLTFLVGGVNDRYRNDSNKARAIPNAHLGVSPPIDEL